jgi:hypothetical protein
MAIGTKPREATNAVIRTGRRRETAPSITAFVQSRLLSISLRVKLTNTKPFKTETPERAINPTAADIENGIPLSHNASIPPERANGTPLKTSSVYLKDLNVKKIRPNTLKRTIGTTTISRLRAEIRCSY